MKKISDIRSALKGILIMAIPTAYFVVGIFLLSISFDRKILEMLVTPGFVMGIGGLVYLRWLEIRNPTQSRQLQVSSLVTDLGAVFIIAGAVPVQYLGQFTREFLQVAVVTFSFVAFHAIIYALDNVAWNQRPYEETDNTASIGTMPKVPLRQIIFHAVIGLAAVMVMVHLLGMEVSFGARLLYIAIFTNALSTLNLRRERVPLRTALYMSGGRLLAAMVIVEVF